MNLVLVNAETLSGNGETEAEVTVGSVAVPVYSVEITWDNFVFDWKYDNNNNNFYWGNHGYCTAATSLNEVPGEHEGQRYGFVYENTFYSNDTCTTEISDKDALLDSLEAGNATAYYVSVDTEATINVYDTSTNGYVTVGFDWEAESKYNFTTANFKYYKDVESCVAIPTANVDEYGAFTNSNCSGERTLVANAPEGTQFYEYDIQWTATAFQSELPLEAGTPAGYGIEGYTVGMTLDVDRTKTITTPTAGDKIGTLTISIETH
jgi:hypothetical protein